MAADDLLNYYHEELIFIRQFGEEFAKAHPKIASRLRLSAKTVDDPHVERLIQAFALGNARIRHKIEDDFPEISESLLNFLQPHYLSPIPSMSVIQFQADENKLAAGKTLPASTQLVSDNHSSEPCFFQTCYPVTLLPIRVDTAIIASKPAVAPVISTVRYQSALRLVLRCTHQKLVFSELNINNLRFYIHSEQAYRLYELLFSSTVAIAIANSPTDPQPIILEKDSLQAVGFEEQEGLLPYNKRTDNGYRLLTEYFSFPEKFLFFDLVNIEKQINKKCSQAEQELEIYFYLNKSDPALENHIDDHTFLLGCTPIINLFEWKAEPIELSHLQSEYHLIADARRSAENIEIYSVNQVVGNLDDSTCIEYLPFYDLKHHQEHAYYHVTRKPAWYANHYSKGTEIFLSFTDFKGNIASNKKCTIMSTVYCTNKDLPSRLPFNNNQLGLSFYENKIDSVKSIKCLMPMTPARWPAFNKGAKWQYVSHLGLNHLFLTDDPDSIEALRNLLKMYDSAENSNHQNLINSLVEIKSKHITIRNPYEWRGNVFWQGTEINLVIDETQFGSTSFQLFGSILSHFFALYTTINSFTQLIITAKYSGIKYDFPPMSGNRQLL